MIASHALSLVAMEHTCGWPRCVLSRPVFEDCAGTLAGPSVLQTQLYSGIEFSALSLESFVIDDITGASICASCEGAFVSAVCVHAFVKKAVLQQQQQSVPCTHACCLLSCLMHCW
jgi:hypothetical protein